MPKIKPAIDLISEDIKHEIHADGLHISNKPLTIGIDGNEANVGKRVGSNMVAYRLLHSLKKLNTPYKWIIYLKDQPREDLPQATENWMYKVIPMARLWTQIRLPWELYTGKKRPDVFFSAGHYAPRLCPMPLVTMIMDTAYLDFPEYFRKADLVQLKTWTKTSVKRADHIVAISQSTKNDIIRHYKKFDQQITVAHLGIDHKHFTFPQSDREINRVKQKYNIPNDYFLYVGTLQPRKNLTRLIEAFKIVIDARQGKKPNDLSISFENFSLVIAGKKGWLYEEIFDKVKELGLEKQVIFTDYVPDEDLPGLMAGARGLLLVALYEGFGIPVIEAMSVGTPAVVSNISSLPEILGNAGYMVNPEDIEDIAVKMGKLLELNDKEYYRLAEKGINHAELFTWEQTAKTVMKVLEHTSGLPT